VTDGISYELARVRVGGDGETTVYLVRHPLERTRVRVVAFEEAQRLDVWCRRHGQSEAIVAGFFVRDPWRALGEVRAGGSSVASEPIEDGWGPMRGTILADGDVTIAPRAALPPEPSGDLVQAGPMLVSEGRVVAGKDDPEGFSAGSGQFDSDITVERHPRCALGVGNGELLALCCDGRRTGVDSGLMLDELARLLVSFGAETAVNLDGGGSATLVHRGHLLNRPYSEVDQPGPESRPVVTALLFEPA
jgi:hypothetical protein